MPKFIGMKHFRDKELFRKADDENTLVPLGQIIGQCNEVKRRLNTLPDGSQKESISIFGDFEAVAYKDGEILRAGSVYLPNYFAEELEAALKKSDGYVIFGVEIGVRPTGIAPPGVQFTYEVTNLAKRAPTSPLEMLKRQLAKDGVLRLPAPEPLIAGEATTDMLPAPAASAEEAPSKGKVRKAV